MAQSVSFLQIPKCQDASTSCSTQTGLRLSLGPHLTSVHIPFLIPGTILVCSLNNLSNSSLEASEVAIFPIQNFSSRPQLHWLICLPQFFTSEVSSSVRSSLPTLVKELPLSLSLSYHLALFLSKNYFLLLGVRVRAGCLSHLHIPGGWLHKYLFNVCTKDYSRICANNKWIRHRSCQETV